MIKKRLESFYQEIGEGISLVAVSKTKTIEDIMSAYNSGQRLFGENRVQELTNKYSNLPKDIKWNMMKKSGQIPGPAIIDQLEKMQKGAALAY